MCGALLVISVVSLELARVECPRTCEGQFVSTGRAGVACRDEAANDVGESALVDLLSNPVLIDEVTDVHPPRIASGDGGWAYRCFGCSDVLSTRT
jgi:hypothetical protein